MGDRTTASHMNIPPKKQDHRFCISIASSQVGIFQ